MQLSIAPFPRIGGAFMKPWDGLCTFAVFHLPPLLPNIAQTCSIAVIRDSALIELACSHTLPLSAYSFR